MSIPEPFYYEEPLTQQLLPAIILHIASELIFQQNSSFLPLIFYTIAWRQVDGNHTVVGLLSLFITNLLLNWCASECIVQKSRLIYEKIWKSLRRLRRSLPYLLHEWLNMLFCTNAVAAVDLVMQSCNMGVFGVGQFNGVIQICLRLTLVTMATN